MIQSPMIQQLLEAKKEITALKTAHQRGLGLLKVYEKEIEMTLGGGSWYGVLAVTIEATLKNGESPYPFASFLPKIDLSDPSLMRTGEVGGLIYALDGMKLIFSYGILVPQGSTITQFAKIRATSEIDSVTYHVEPV